MIHTFAEFQPSVSELFRLADTPFEPGPFRTACSAIAEFNPGISDDDIWRFEFPDGPNLMVCLSTEPDGTRPGGWPRYRPVSVLCAVLSTCLWETFLRTEHESDESWQAERSQFDSRYEAALSNAIAAIGIPRRQGADCDETRHRHAIWRGAHGLMVLQQSAYDPQFGHDVNFWFHPWVGPDPVFTSPLIDWLTRDPE